MEEETQKITLVTEDGTKFRVPKQIADVSGLIHNIIQDVESTEDIPLDQVNENTFKSILEFLEYHQFKPPVEIKKPVPNNNLVDCVEDPQDAEFIIKFDNDSMLLLINAANYLDIKGLLDLCCAKIACDLKGKTIEEMQQDYGIEEGFTPQEEEELKRENPWALEGGEDRFVQAKKLASNP